MNQGYGPHHIIPLGEIVVTVSVFLMAMVAFLWMAYRTSRPREAAKVSDAKPRPETTTPAMSQQRHAV